MAAVACAARLQCGPSLLLFRAVAVGDDTNDHPSSSIEKKKTQAKRTSAYRQTTSPPPRPPSMPRSDARFRDDALSSPVKKSAMVEVTAAAVTEASVEVTVKAEEEARTFLLLSLLLLLQVSGKVAASVDNDESPDPPPTRTKECVGLVLDLVRRNRLHRFSVEE